MAPAREISRSEAVGVGFLTLVCLLGGASRHNALQLLIVELVSLPVLALALFEMKRVGWRAAPVPLAILAAIILVPLIQLVPLPPSVWTSLPGRGRTADILRLAGLMPRWQPLSLAPKPTLSALLFLLPASAVFLRTLSASSAACRSMAAAVAALALASLVLGVFQVSAPQLKFLYPYEDTNFGSAVGLFANRNHHATLLLSAIPLLVAWALTARSGGVRPLGVAAFLACVVLIGLAGVQSRAGVLLAAPAVLGALALVARARGLARRRTTIALVAAPVLATALLVAGLAPSALVDRFAEPVSRDARASAVPGELAAAGQYGPTGSGLGSYAAVFEAVERLEMVDPTYMNHAHDDYLELWMETGWFAPPILAAFLAWFGVRAATVWRARSPAPGAILAMGGTIVIALVLLHSALDYPLRTPAVAAVFAFACGLLARPSARLGRAPRHRRADGAPTPA